MCREGSSMKTVSTHRKGVWDRWQRLSFCPSAPWAEGPPPQLVACLLPHDLSFWQEGHCRGQPGADPPHPRSCCSSGEERDWTMLKIYFINPSGGCSDYKWWLTWLGSFTVLEILFYEWELKLDALIFLLNDDTGFFFFPINPAFGCLFCRLSDSGSSAAVSVFAGTGGNFHIRQLHFQPLGFFSPPQMKCWGGA